MSDMAQARKNMHEREEKRKKDSKSKKMKVKNFFFGCCKIIRLILWLILIH